MMRTARLEPCDSPTRPKAPPACRASARCSTDAPPADQHRCHGDRRRHPADRGAAHRDAPPRSAGTHSASHRGLRHPHCRTGHRRRRAGPARDRRKRCRRRRRTTRVRGYRRGSVQGESRRWPWHPHAVSAGDSALPCSPLRRLTTAYDDDCTVGPVEAGEPAIERPAHVRGRTAVPQAPGAGTVDDREACLDERICLDHAGKRAAGRLPRHSHVLRVGVRPPSSRRGGGVPPRPRGWPTALPCAVAGRCCCR